MQKLLIISAAALALSACSNKGADSDGDGKVSASEAKAEMAQGGAMKMIPGLWEMKITFNSIDAPGLPDSVKAQMKDKMGEGMTAKSCLTKEQADNPDASFFGGDEGANCNFDKLDRSGSNIVVAMTCKPAGGITLNTNMEGSFAAESYSMTMDQKMSGSPMGELTMKGKIEGKRVGECPA
jgi:hypothetical protein